MKKRILSQSDYKQAEANGINKNTLRNRVYNCAWDVEEAITTPPRKKRVSKKSQSEIWLEIAVKNGMNPNTFYSRLNLGFTPEEAATKPVKQTSEFIKKMAKLAEKNGINYQTFHSRIRNYKWDIELAATVSPIETGRRCSN
ncbi:nucleoside permease [Bacillus wiedmannii]|uniref:nucleoside permease n=1 Tax=Bacillus wiedmannii TaxID=1890302 RepID=UPI0025A0C99C|nr:nucleoside permease [Bacillus wiedmannii]MDM5270496.1 nucleoside permease [Bacillus wiedmannii]